MRSHTLPNGSAPCGGVTNDAAVRLPDHAEYRATRTNVNSAFVRTTRWYRQRRVVVEHRLARLVQLGIRQSRYFGRTKTRFQLYLAATVANLTLVPAKAGLTEETGSGPSAGSALAAGMGNSAANSGAAWLGQIWTLILLAAASLPKSLFPTRGFPAGFLGPPHPGCDKQHPRGEEAARPFWRRRRLL